MRCMAALSYEYFGGEKSFDAIAAANRLDRRRRIVPVCDGNGADIAQKIYGPERAPATPRYAHD